MADEKLKEQYKQLIGILQKNTRMAMESFIKAEYQKVSAALLQSKIAKIFPGMICTMYDRQYQLTKWTTWIDIIDFDWTNQKQYVTDVYDCDNFSGSFCSRAAEFFNLNTAGRFSCVVTTATGEKIPHRAVLIAAIDENDEIAFYVFESQNDGWQKVVNCSEIVIQNDYQKAWSYQGNLCEFN